MEGKELRDAYLLWIKQQRDQYASSNFGCLWEKSNTLVDYIFGSEDVTYYEVIEQIVRNPNCTDKFVRELWEADAAYIKKIRSACKSQELPLCGNKFFITITTDKERATPSKLLKFLYWLRDKCKWVKTMTAVIENHRENGIILHTHILLETTEDSEIKYGSKVKDKLWGLKMLKELIGGSNYIDYMFASERHEKYIRGEKRDEKMEYVIKDREWRKAHNIPELIIKS